MNSPENDPVSAPERSTRARGDRKVRYVAFGVSAALHVVAVLLYSLNIGALLPRAGRVPASTAAGPTEPEGTQLVNLVEIETPDPEIEAPIEEPEPEEEEEEEEPPVLPVAVPGPGETEGGVGQGADEGPDPISAADVFRYRVQDPTLFAVARPDLLLLTREERQELEIQGRLEAWNDSINAAIAAEAAMLDWTKTDGNGGRWGVSPGKLHLGKITLPLPFGFGPNPWQSERIAERQARDRDIAFHAQSQAVRASWKERAEAIRRRKDRERERARENAGDTTSSRRGGGGGLEPPR